MSSEFADRLKKIPPYLFAEIEEKVDRKKAEGLDIIDLGIGDPDLPTPQPLVEEIKRQLDDPENHRYPSSGGERDTRVAIAEWYARRFGVDLDPDREVAILLGSKEGLANIARAFVNPRDRVLCPNPAYPVYAQGATLLCDAQPVKVPLYEKDGFLPDLNALPSDAKMLFLNYPNNPTGATATTQFLKEALRWCEETETILCYDNAYSEMTFDDYIAPSILELGRGAIEFGSLSKTFNMTGYRLGYAVGDAKLVAGLKKVKSQIDSGAPKFIQKAAAVALGEYTGRQRPAMVEANVKVYQERRDVMVRGLRNLGFDIKLPKGTFYLFFNVGGSSIEFANRMLEAGIVVTPGIGFGENGEGFVRMALTQSVPRLEEALERMSKVL
ncbi:MAG: aminotransferase class I/II-fold pyridoxal phosphate-dependent enzyme [Methanomassiliicoccus sp.]|nr:aminotransferase class I/II-fold pyridoxal phosphate-dependent enzyme [Methanomassiliicoccus sp.]